MYVVGTCARVLIVRSLRPFHLLAVRQQALKDLEQQHRSIETVRQSMQFVIKSDKRKCLLSRFCSAPAWLALN